VAWDRDDANPVRHDNVFALAEDPKARFLQRSHSIEVIDSGNLRHDLDRDTYLANVLALHQLVYGG
jgi:hypothetical protein